jgi:predicted protein tyrosine phosphatase
LRIGLKKGRIITVKKEVAKMSQNILVIGKLGVNRSQMTCEILNEKGFVADFCGTSDSIIPWDRELIEERLAWAEILILMDNDQLEWLKQYHPNAITEKDIHVLGVEDTYDILDPQLVSVLNNKINRIQHLLAKIDWAGIVDFEYSYSPDRSFFEVVFLDKEGSEIGRENIDRIVREHIAYRTNN